MIHSSSIGAKKCDLIDSSFSHTVVSFGCVLKALHSYCRCFSGWRYGLVWTEDTACDNLTVAILDY